MRYSDITGGIGDMEGDKQVTLHYLDLTQLSTICWRNGGRRKDRINLRDTLNSLEGARGMEEDKYVVLHYFVFFQSSKICWRNGGRGRDKFYRDSKFSGGSQNLIL